MSNKKLAGLYIDGRKAIVVSNHDAQEVSDFKIVDTVKADVQSGNSSENAANNASKTNQGKFFKEVEKLITNSTDLYITGPGNFQEELRNYLLDTAQFKNLNIKLGTSAQISDTQVLDEVKAHFNA